MASFARRSGSRCSRDDQVPRRINFAAEFSTAITQTLAKTAMALTAISVSILASLMAWTGRERQGAEFGSQSMAQRLL
jgi:hypothetical protein